MKLWGLRKNLASDAWRHVDRTFQKRCAAGKRSLVILSGRRLSAQTVQNKTKRHKLVTWNRRKYASSSRGLCVDCYGKVQVLVLVAEVLYLRNLHLIESSTSPVYIQSNSRIYS